MMNTARAIHVCATDAFAGPGRRWPQIESIEDTLQRARSICWHAGIVDEEVLAGPEATTTGVIDALRRAGRALSGGGLLVLTFAGHTERGDRPVEQACWCLFDGGLEVSRVSDALAQLAVDVQIVVITETCYASAIASTLGGSHAMLVLASCGEDQTTTVRVRSELMTRLERFFCAPAVQASVGDLRRYLEHDTPDCERPCVWTNTASSWPMLSLSSGDRSAEVVD